MTMVVNNSNATKPEARKEGSTEKSCRRARQDKGPTRPSGVMTRELLEAVARGPFLC